MTNSTQNDHETHIACIRRIQKEGASVTCCYCNPHEDCTLHSKEIDEMEKAIDEGFVESEKAIKGMKTPFDKSAQNIKEWAGGPMHPRDSTQNDEIEVDGETYVKWDTQNDWEKRFDELFDYRHYDDQNEKWASILDRKDYNPASPEQIKDFIRKELADARREVIEEIENKLESIQFVYEHQWTDEAVEKLCERCGEVIKIGTPCEASIHITCWKLLESVLATLRKEES